VSILAKERSLISARSAVCLKADTPKTFNPILKLEERMKKLLILSVLGAIVVTVAVFCVSLVEAEIPKLINYQGMLTDDSGNPVNGSPNIIFRIYDDTTGGAQKWTETHSGVPVTNGLFNVILGSDVPIDTLSFSQQYWLEVQVDDDTMPRLRFTSVGYAYRAQRADTADYALGGGGGSGSPWIFSITDGGDTTITTGGRWGIARYGNVLYGNKDSTHVNLGVACTTGTSGTNHRFCTVGGGKGNTASGRYATVGGGYSSTADTSYATVGGGYHNIASGFVAIVGGGYYNTASGSHATVAGGTGNTASGYTATVGGGSSNSADTNYATVGGGYHNTASGCHATVGGGSGNTADTNHATVGGGKGNTASGYSATVGGGYNNTASGDYSFAAGRRAKANHSGAFVWADGSGTDFASTGTNQFLIRASGGVGIGTNSPEEMLHVQNSVEGVIKVGTPTSDGNATIIFEEGNDDALALRYNGSANELRIDDETKDSTRMVIERSGNVGIGTTDPNYKLDVEGYIQAHGYYTGDIIFQKEKKKLWRMFEDEDGLYLENLKTGKIYTFVLQEVQKE
jgi:hypothetical protein